MIILGRVAYITCDKCGKKLRNPIMGGETFISSIEALAAAAQDGWKVIARCFNTLDIGAGVYCAECVKKLEGKK